MEPITATNGLFPNVPSEMEPTLAQSLNASFVTRCRCGQVWNVTMERGEPGNPGCLSCPTCHAEIVSWSGMVTFNAVPVDVD
jgi:hypothetical protein